MNPGEPTNCKIGRRRYIHGVSAIGAVALAGCLGNNDEPDDEPDDHLDDEPDDTDDEPDDTDEPAPGEITYSVEPAATELDWGEEYAVTVTARAGSDAPIGVTVIEYQPEGETRWSNLVHTRSSWDLEDGESMTKTHDIDPPASGEIAFRLKEELLDTAASEWRLLLRPPRAAVGETIPFYDGLELTTEVELLDSKEFMLVDRREQTELGVYPVRPKGGQWVVATLTAENTSMNTDVRLPEQDDINALADEMQLARPRATGHDVGDAAGFEYEVADETAADREGWFEPRQEAGFYDPPPELIPDATYDGWNLFEVDAETTVEDITIVVNQQDVRATWE